MKQISILALFVSAAASAEDFDARVAEAKAAEATSVGAKYEQSLGPHVGGAMRVCIPPGSESPANLGTFALVGRVTATGKLTDVEVNPSTAILRCFANKMQLAELPSPPLLSSSFSSYPIEVEMRINP